MKKIDPKVDEAIQTLNMKDGPSRRKLLAGTGLVSATAAASALLAACTRQAAAAAREDTESGAAAVAGNFPKTPAWKFYFVNHVTTNAFFTPTQYGMADAAALLGLPTPVWGGSTTRSSPRWSPTSTPRSPRARPASRWPPSAPPRSPRRSRAPWARASRS